jgi:hypothetical protein
VTQSVTEREHKAQITADRQPTVTHLPIG